MKLIFKNPFGFLVFFFGYFSCSKSLSENFIRGISVSYTTIKKRRSKNPDDKKYPDDPPNNVHPPEVITIIKYKHVVFFLNE